MRIRHTLSKAKQRRQTYPSPDKDPNTVYVYTDGSSKLFDDLAWGGWAAILVWGDYEVELTGNLLGGTTGLMEMTAILEGLSYVKSSFEGRILIVSDSQYAVNALTVWWRSWEQNGWVTGTGSPVQHLDVLRDILKRITHRVSLRWVKGHAGHEFNERADVLATEARDRLMREIMGTMQIKGGPLLYNPTTFGSITIGGDGSGKFYLVKGEKIIKLSKDEARDIAFDLADRCRPREDRTSAIHRYEPGLAKAIDKAMEPPPPPPQPRKRVRTQPVTA